jgi:3-hydroxyacyl-CoA dehydrogenase / enoyl-CoA hydratase / 3-hydroxybutyryl-CoA epimerase
VVLIDRDQAAADKGKAYSADYMDKGIARKKATPETKAALLALITATPDLDALKGCDLIVEAVFEDVAVKAEMTRKVEAVVGPDCIFATNTSTCPSANWPRPASGPSSSSASTSFRRWTRWRWWRSSRVPQTGDRAVAKALDFVRQIRKTPIVVNDARFFYANRCIIPYLNEGLRMVREGIAPGVDRECGQAGGPAARPAATDRRDLD